MNSGWSAGISEQEGSTRTGGVVESRSKRVPALSLDAQNVKYSGLAPVPGDSSESSMVHVDDTRGQ